MISVIIPIYNEEEILLGRSQAFAELSRSAELIFVDGGSVDKSARIVSEYGRVINSTKGRARQMNAGARDARNKLLFFLHADNALSVETIKNIEKKMQDNRLLGGCLTQRIDKERLIFRLIEWQGNCRARATKIFYGDQGIFVRKDVFEQIGGFPDVPIFEDVLFSKKLKREGKTTILSDKIVVSPRRWEKRGVVKTTFMFNRLLIMFKMGYPLEKIKALYEDLR